MIEYYPFTKEEKDIIPFIIYLKADPVLLYERAKKRSIETGQPLRNKSLQEVRDEIDAEEYFFNKLISIRKFDSLSIDTTIYDKSTVLNKTKIKVLEYKKNF